MSGPFDIFGLGTDPDRPDESPARKAQLASAKPLPKRFYKSVSLTDEEGLFTLALDGRPVRTPARKLVQLTQKMAAEGLVFEWQSQGEFIDPKTMPIMRLVNSALDGVSEQIISVQDEIIRFSGTDLLCYRAETPERLVERQNAHWDPVIQWAEEFYDCRFHLAAGVLHVAQDKATLEAIGMHVQKVSDPIELSALHSMTTLLGSCLLSLSVFEGELSAEDAWKAAHVDEDWNIEQWGEDEEAKSRRAYRWAEMKAAALLMGAAVS